jgi:hypothetical protein
LGDDTPQVDRFRELARELECEEDDEALDEQLKVLARSPAKQMAADHLKGDN